MPYSQNKKAVKEVRYLNKDFSSFKANLIEFAKIYFPNTYNDFNEASPGMMFIEMASYVGDVLSYYVDNQFKESLLSFAQEKRTVYNMAQTFGYKPKLGAPSTGELDVFQTVPAISEGSGENFTTRPDLRYAMEIKSGMILNSSAGVNFTTVEDCNFKFSSSYDPMEISVYESANDVPVTYLLKKSVKIESGNITTEFFSFGNATKFDRIALSNEVVTEIIRCTAVGRVVTHSLSNHRMPPGSFRCSSFRRPSRRIPSKTCGRSNQWAFRLLGAGWLVRCPRARTP